MIDIREWRPAILVEIADLGAQAEQQRAAIAEAKQAVEARRIEVENVAAILARAKPDGEFSPAIGCQVEALRQSLRQATGGLTRATMVLQNIEYRLADRREALAHLDRAIAAQSAPLALVSPEPAPDDQPEPGQAEESAADRYRRIHGNERSAA